MSIGAADAVGLVGQGKDAGVDMAGHQRRSCLEQSPVAGSGGGTSCPQVSHLLPGCWGLPQSSGIPPELGAGPSCLSGLELGDRGSRDVSWGNSFGRPVTHLLFQLVWVTLCAFSDY